MPIRDESATNPAEEYFVSKKLNCVGVKPENEPEENPCPDMFMREAWWCWPTASDQMGTHWVYTILEDCVSSTRLLHKAIAIL